MTEKTHKTDMTVDEFLSTIVASTPRSVALPKMLNEENLFAFSSGVMFALEMVEHIAERQAVIVAEHGLAIGDDETKVKATNMIRGIAGIKRALGTSVEKLLAAFAVAAQAGTARELAGQTLH